MSGNNDDESSGSRRRWLVGAMAVLAVPVAVIWWPGCRQYPPVSSKESLGLMKLLYSACNAKDGKRLAEVDKGVNKLSREGRMTSAEKEGFDWIIVLAKEGKWEKAEEAAYKFAQDQVGVGHPDGHDRTHGRTGKTPKVN